MPDSPSDRDASASPDELLADSPPGDNAAPLTVSEISAALKREVEGRFGHVRIRGEISGFKRAASGHCYLTLKDDRAVIDGVIWRGQGGRIAFQADLFDTHEPPRAAQLPAMRSLNNQVQRMNLDVETLAPVHGRPVPWSEFMTALSRLESQRPD